MDEMEVAGYLPSLIVAGEDKPKGRKLILTPTETKIWADKRAIPCIQPKTLRGLGIIPPPKDQASYDFFMVASYGKFLPDEILEMPRRKTLNVHPSLLPKLRGASPIQSAILTEDETGVTIIRLDSEMDHGPIVAQREIPVPDWPPYAADLSALLAREGGKLLAEILPGWVGGELAEKEQDHDLATFTKKMKKEDGLLDLSAPAEVNLRKIRAYHLWPGAYFFARRGEKSVRVLVKKARIEGGELVMERVVPEGKPEMDYADFIRSYMPE